LWQGFLMKITYYHFPVLDSTNSWAKEHKLDFHKEECTAIYADEQTKDRGRHARLWISPKNRTLSLSLCVFDHTLPPFFFSQLASLVLVDLLKKKEVAAKIKWPNDLVVDDKKIAGILTEIEHVDGQRMIVVGIGLNVLLTAEELLEIPQKATSIFAETKKEYSISKLAEEVTEKFVELLEQAKKCGVETLQKRWHEAVVWMVMKESTVKRVDGEIRGRIFSIEKDGALSFIIEDGTVHNIISGDLYTV
jgi:BirA family transcriptional regulator, biotin operon repressor / biotin---[acetyl-CoA-carboxylase] ligase